MSHSNGGSPHNEFVFKHYTKTGVRNPKTKHWQVECHYCPDKKIIEHRDMKCFRHLAYPDLCPNAPADGSSKDWDEATLSRSLRIAFWVLLHLE